MGRKIDSMPLRTLYLQRTENQSQEREDYLQRIAPFQREAQANDPAASGNDAAAKSGVDDWLARSSTGFRLKSAIHTFSKWFVRFALVVILVALVALILYWWSPWTNPVGAPTAIEPASSMTARGSHLAAEPIARQWAADARLVSLSAIWDAGRPFQDGEGDWSLLYYSPTKSATALVSVHDGRAALVGVHGRTQSITLPQENGWQIDSPTAIDRMRAAGGDEFLRSQPDAIVSLSLDLSQDAVWSVRLIDQMSRRAFAVRVSIDSGEILDVHQTG